MSADGSKSPQTLHPGQEADSPQWRELRNLLLRPEQRQLAKITERLDDPARRAEELSQALPDALMVGAARDDRIARALQPSVDAALKVSVHKNPKALADAIFPALGPAIRKAISTTLMAMVQSLNLILNQSFSWRGLKWRLESLRSHRPFAEVVLLHTLVYRVEQVYLIHRNSGLVIQHVAADPSASRDPDLVSGMLTAIQDFVKDAFDRDRGEILDTLRMDGDHSLWIDQGPHAILATVIRGTPPLELRKRLRQVLDAIHFRYGPSVADFEGEVGPFAMVKPLLEDALLFQIREAKTRISPLMWVLGTAAVAASAFWAWHAFKANGQWRHYLELLQAERGITIISSGRRDGHYFVSGFRDPLSEDPMKLLEAAGLDQSLVSNQWQPYQALDEVSILRRVRHQLRPPPTVKLTLQGGTLTVQGSASHAWVRMARHKALAISGVQAYDEISLQDVQLAELRANAAALEQQVVYFNLGTARLRPDQMAPLQTALAKLMQIQALCRTHELGVRVTTIGHTDPTGPLDLNLQLSRQRSQAVVNFFIHKGIDPTFLSAVGAGPTEAKAREAGRREHRSVTFRAWVSPE